MFDVVVAGLDWGVANLFACHDQHGQRWSMTQGEYRSLAKLTKRGDVDEEHQRWDRGASNLVAYVAMVYTDFDRILKEYGAVRHLQARLTVRASMPAPLSGRDHGLTHHALREMLHTYSCITASRPPLPPRCAGWSRARACPACGRDWWWCALATVPTAPTLGAGPHPHTWR